MHKQVQGTIHKTLIKKGSEASWIHYISPSYKVKWPSLDFKIKEGHWKKND